jgi:glutamate synthase domain-containing protein 2
VAALLALGCNRPDYPDVHGPAASRIDVRHDYVALGTEAGSCAHCHTGRCPVGITTQDPLLVARLDPELAATRVANYLRAVTMEVTALARACGKSDVHHLEPEDLVALTIEAAAMAKVPLAGTTWIPGWNTGGQG